jgi:hypothetical protein
VRAYSRPRHTGRDVPPQESAHMEKTPTSGAA